MILEQRRRALLAARSGSRGWTSDGIADLSEPNGALFLKSTKIGDYAFHGRYNICSVTGSSVSAMGNYAFQGCRSLSEVHLPSLSSGNYIGAFSECVALRAIHAGDLPRVLFIGQSMFSGCSNLELIVLPGAISIAYQGTNNCSRLAAVDLGRSGPSAGNGILANAFGSCPMLTTIILRRSALITLGNVNALSGTPFRSSGAGGTLYVPQALISAYQAAANWNTLLGYENNRILPIEGSVYENAYADGTPLEGGSK